MDDIHRILSFLEHSDRCSVLATIMHVEGSAYRKAGASALFLEDGRQIGVISAGCIDVDLAARVPNVLRSNLSQRVVFDLAVEDDLSWGKGTGCNGVVQILLEPVHGEFRQHFELAKSYLERRAPVSLVRRLTTEYTVDAYAFIPEHQPSFGMWAGELPEELQNPYLRAKPYIPRGALYYNNSLKTMLYVQHFRPKPRLVLLGGGLDTEPLAAAASQTGFEVIVGDRRRGYRDAAEFPLAHAFYTGCWTDILDELQLTEDDSVIIMTHQFQDDRVLLNLLEYTPLRYLGIMGPRERTSRLLHGAPLPERLRSPVGLSIGAEGPEEIAISVVADVIRAMRHRGN